MKKSLLTLLVAFTMVASLLQGIFTVSGAKTVTDQAGNVIEVVGDNLIKNPSFEQGLGKTPWADPNPEGGWTIWGMNSNNIVSTLPEGKQIPDGTKAFHLVRQASQKDNWATLKQTVALKPGKSYIFTAYLMAPHNVAFGIGVTIFDDNSKISSFSREKDANGVLEFQKVSATFAVPAAAVNPKATVSCGLGETENQKYIDMVEIYEIADPSKVKIEEKEGAVFTGNVTIKLKQDTKELDLKLVGDNTTPTSLYDNRSKYLEDILFNVNRDFGAPDTVNINRMQRPVDVYDRETLEAAKNIVKQNPKSNDILSTDYIDAYIEQQVALRPGFINYLAQMMEAERMGITVVPVSNPWWQYMRLENGQTEYTEEQKRFFYKMLWVDSWCHGFTRGYIYAKYFGQTNYNMGNEPDNKDKGVPKFTDWELYAQEITELADGFRTGVEAAGYKREDAQLWGPTLAGWNPNAWDTIAKFGDGAIDVYDYHAYGGGPGAHRSRIQNFKARIDAFNSDNQKEKISASEFNWQLSGQSFDWLDKMPACISHIQIMREQAIQGLYASIRFSFGEMFFKDNATSRFLIPERMYYAIRQFDRTLTKGNVMVGYDLTGAASNQEFFVTKGENSYFIHLINNVTGSAPTTLTVDLSSVGSLDGRAAVLREMSETKNDEVVATKTVTGGKVTFEGLKGTAMYLVTIAHSDFEIKAPEIHRAFGYADSAEVWWTNEPDYTSYNVYKSTDGVNFKLAAKDVYNSYYEDHDVKSGEKYYYYVEPVVYGKTGPKSETAGPITLKPGNALPYMGDFENGTLDGFDVAGDFAVEESQYVHNAVGTAQKGQISSIVISGGEKWRDYTVNTTANPRQITEGASEYGKMGILVRYTDENNYYKCVLDSAARTVSIIKIKNGQAETLASKPIPDAFKVDNGKSIPMSVSLSGDTITFYAEMSAYEPPVGQRSASVTVNDSDIPQGKAGLFVEDGAKASFGSIKVTEVFSDFFSGGKRSDWEEVSGSWSTGVVDDGTVANWWYTQSDSTGDDWKMSLATSGNIIDGYVAGKILTNGTAALVAKYVDKDNFLRYQVEGDTFSVISRVNGVEKVEQSCKIPARTHDYITVAVYFDRNYQTVAIGGQNVLKYHLYIPELQTGKFGVATKGSTASFDQFLVSATSVPLELPYFTDTANHWAKDSIAAMAQWGYIKGKTAETFDPEANLTRAEYIAMVSRISGGSDKYVYNNACTDVTASDWYAGIIQWAVDNGLIDSAMMEGGKINPNAPITREEIASISVRAIKKFNKFNKLTEGDMSKFTDASSISPWAQDYLKLCIGSGIIAGRTETTIVPQGTATRAEAAVLLQRTYKLMY